MIDFKAIGQRIRQHRKFLGYTQEALAEKLDVSVEHLSRIETGAQRPSLLLLEHVCDLFQLQEVTLLFGIIPDSDLDIGLLRKIEALSDEKKKVIMDLVEIIQ